MILRLESSELGLNPNHHSLSPHQHGKETQRRFLCRDETADLVHVHDERHLLQVNRLPAAVGSRDDYDGRGVELLRQTNALSAHVWGWE